MKAAFATAVFFLLAVMGLAQTTLTPPYKIRQDDTLRIQVYGENQAAAEVPVGEDGNISAPFVGTLRAVGKTTAELEAELTVLYKAKLRIRDPKVSVTMGTFAPLRAFVGGAVGRPGVVIFRPGDRILTLVTQAGDPVDGAADLHRAILHHKGSEEGIPIDLYAMLRRGDLSQNYLLEDGDQLDVPVDTQNVVSVLGFVQRPGQFPFREPMRLIDAVTLAGSEIPRRSRMTHVRVFRQDPGSPGTQIQIQADLVRYWNNGDISQNVELRKGDVIYVPATNTPDINELANTVNSVFFLQSILRGGLFGIRIFR